MIPLQIIYNTPTPISRHKFSDLRNSHNYNSEVLDQSVRGSIIQSFLVSWVVGSRTSVFHL